MEDQDGERGFKTIYTGPANPHGDVTWNIPGMNIGYGELKAIEMYELEKQLWKDISHLLTLVLDTDWIEFVMQFLSPMKQVPGLKLNKCA